MGNRLPLGARPARYGRVRRQNVIRLWCIRFTFGAFCSISTQKEAIPRQPFEGSRNDSDPGLELQWRL
jgi:hypothetical protein